MLPKLYLSLIFKIITDRQAIFHVFQMLSALHHLIRFYVSYPTDRTAVIRYFYLKNSDTNLAINPYLTKLNRKVFNLNILKNNPASLPISSMMIVFWTQYVYTISQCGIILISLTQRSTNTIPLQVGINRLSVVLLGYNIISLSFVRTRVVIQSALPSEIVVGLTIYRTQKCQNMLIVY